MPEHLILRLDGPLQAWGDVALDPRRPTLPCPTRSALAGLLANALGWRYRDAARITALQDSLRFAVREDRPPQPIIDYQTADLDDVRGPDRPRGKDPGWCSWGLEGRGSGTQILWKHYLAGGAFRVALTLAASAPVSLDELAEALRRPARPLFLGRKSCPPAGPILESTNVEAPTPLAAVQALPPLRAGDDTTGLRCWHDRRTAADVAAREIADRRDFATNRFAGSRWLVETVVPARQETEP